MGVLRSVRSNEREEQSVGGTKSGTNEEWGDKGREEQSVGGKRRAKNKE
jgi:hypothetical protein